MSFVAKESYDKNDLLSCGQGMLFGDGNGRLPTPDMLMFDRINSITKDGGDFNHFLSDFQIAFVITSYFGNSVRRLVVTHI